MNNPENELEQYLQREGFDVMMAGGRCPFQIEANHRSGISIYFRSRDTTASLEVYRQHYNYDDDLPEDEEILWQSEYNCWEKYEAGWIDWSEAFYVFYSLWIEAKAWVLD